MICPNCSQDIPLNQQYCPICGKKVQVDIQEIEDSVAADVASRRTELTEKVLINAIGALIVVWVGLALWNSYYDQLKFPGDRGGSISFSAPPSEVKGENRLEVALTAPVVPVPEIPRIEPRGMSWRRDPFREKLRAAGAGDQVNDVANCVAGGLKFLASRQQADGGWLVSGEEGGFPKNDWGRCGVTALACLAFLGDGHAWGADDKDPYAAVVRKGIGFLVSKQDATGCFGLKKLPDNTFPHYMYNQGMATAAVAEAYGMTGEPALRPVAQNAVKYILTAQQRLGGWDYYDIPGSRSDTSVTAWQLMALYSASQAGLNVPAVAFDNGLTFIDAMTDNKETFRVGYDKTWAPSERGVGNGSMAIALMLQLYMGRSCSSASVRRQVPLLIAESFPEYDPKWTAEQKVAKVDYYTTYHATMAMQRLGGKDWEKWNKAVVRALKGAQEASGCWPLDKWTAEGGKIYSTALATMTLEVYYRYQ